MSQPKIGVIGGSGLYNIENMAFVEELSIDTPFGKPSDSIFIGKLNDVEIAFLPRHGRGHRIIPTEINSHANIYAMKMLGVENIIAVNSVGSLREEIHPGEIVIVDQLIDCTKHRKNTFFGDGIVAHIQFADPFCPNLRQVLYEAAIESIEEPVHPKGTYIVMEGTAFSTRAESKLHKSWGADLIGMTALPEAKLAREAEICYAIIACPGDYDAWHEHKEPVSVEMLLSTMHRNIELSKKIIAHAVSNISDKRNCCCTSALKNSIVTMPELIPNERKEQLDLIIGKYI